MWWRIGLRSVDRCIHILIVLNSVMGRIEIRTYNIYDGLEIITDKGKWGGNITIVESE